jgi:hypothetical protein
MLVQRPIRQQRDGHGQPDAEAVGPELPAGKGGGHTVLASTHFAMEWGGVLGCLQWPAWQVLAVLVSLPLAMSLLVQFITRCARQLRSLPIFQGTLGGP